MTRRNTIAMAGILSVASLVTPAFADQWNKRTILTVNEPIQIPGRVLQPGKYVMRLLESQSNRHIVQVFNETEQQLVTTILAIPNYRLQPTGETQFGFYETPAGQAKAMRSWFYPGDNFGQEFVYPKTESATIAQYSNTNVPTTYAQTETELATARVATVDKAGTELELDRQTYMRADGQQPATPAATQQMARNTPQSVPAPAETTAAAPATPRALPETGSPAPLVGMLGFLSLGAAAILRRVNR